MEAISMDNYPSQAVAGQIGRVKLNIPKKSISSTYKPFRVGKKSQQSESVIDAPAVLTANHDTAAGKKVRLSSDIPHSTYIALYTYAATVQKRINVIINEMILSQITA
jgi:hypothetical protein